MIEFVCTPLHVRIVLRVTMVTMHLARPICVNFTKTWFSYSWSSKKQFGTNEKLSLGCKVGQIRFFGTGYPISVLI